MVVLFAFGRRESVAALRADAVGGVDHRLALRAFLGGRFAVTTRPIFDLECVDRPVPQNVAAEVQDEAVLLRRVQAEAPTDHLVVEARGVRRPQERHAVDVGRVEAGGQHVHVDQILQAAVLEALEGVGAFERQRVAADEPALVAELAKHALDMHGVLHTGGEDQDRVPVPRMLDDLGAGRTHQRVVVHQGLDLARDELTAPDVQPRGVGLAPTGLGLEAAQEALHDQLAHAHLVADVVEKVLRPADHAGGHAVGRGRQANQPHVGVHGAGLGQDLLEQGRGHLATIVQNPAGIAHPLPQLGAGDLGGALRCHGLQRADGVEIAEPFAKQPAEIDAGDADQRLDPLVDDGRLYRIATAAADTQHTEPLGAISLAGPLSRLTDERIRALGPLVARTAMEITGRMGGKWPHPY